MTDVYIKYNPYKVETVIEIDHNPVTEQGTLSYVFEHRLQEWIEPRANWQGIFQELRSATRDQHIQIRFYGTAFDYDDLVYAKERYGQEFDRVDLVHENKDTCRQLDQGKKIEDLKKLYQELQDGPIEEFKTKDIQTDFESAISSDFQIVIVAPMSSGKSTLINAILGQELLPEANQATTAIITRIKDDDTKTQFYVTAKDDQGKVIRFLLNDDGSFAQDSNKNFIFSPTGKPIEDAEATPELISQLNYAIDPSDPEGKKALVNEATIEGQIEALPSDTISTVFVDTPGGNNAQNRLHQDIMEDAIHDENKSLILYVFNGTQTGTYDSDDILRQIADEMRQSRKGKQSRDRILFVANRMDDFNPEKEDYGKYIQNTILPNLEKHGITEPQLFLVSAKLAKLLRMKRADHPMTKSDRSFLNGKGSLFGDISDGDTRYRLYRYSTISHQLKETYDKELDELIAANPDKEWIDEVAEINSGVPALEAAIRDYVEKYAVCIKINDAHGKFMTKVKERKMIEGCKERWASSEKEFERVKNELEEKEKDRDNNKREQRYLEQIKAVSLDEKPIRRYEASLRRDIDSLVSSLRSSSDQIAKNEAETILKEFKSTTDSALEKARNELVEILKNGAIRECNRIIQEYSNYIRSLEKRGFFNIGGIDVKRLSAYEAFKVDNVDEMLSDSKYSFTEAYSETIIYKKAGFFNAIKRFFGVKSGYGTDIIPHSRDMVRINELVKDKMTEVVTNFSEEVDNALQATKSSIDEVKRAAAEKLNGVNRLVDDAINAVTEMTSNKDALEKSVEENKEDHEWITDFVDRVDKILEI